MLLALTSATLGCARGGPDARANAAASDAPAANVASASTSDVAAVGPSAPPSARATGATSSERSLVASAHAEQSATSAAAAAPTASASAAPSPAATGPQILSVVATPSVVHAGQTVSWDVRTTRDIVTVAANVSAYHLPLQKSGPGHFTLNFTVPPNVPGFFHGTYALDVRGETASGASADRRVSLVFQ